MWRLIWAIPTWVLFQMFIFVPLCALGWVLIPYAAACKAYKLDKSWGEYGKLRFAWPFMWIWDNYEDGIYNDTYWKAPNTFLQICYWSAFRNPVNNLRIVPYLSCKINPELVEFVGSFGSLHGIYMSKDIRETIKQYDTKIPQWFFAWQGYYSNFFWQFNLFGKLYRFWIGWKIYPTDIYGVTEYRKRGAGFALQFKAIK